MYPTEPNIYNQNGSGMLIIYDTIYELFISI